jgi:hypothetical protein
MRRMPLTMRALLLVPLLAVVVDQVRATLACAPGAASCLEAAGQGLGAAGVAVLVAYAVGLALGVARLARGTTVSERVPFWRLWLVGSLGVAAVCGGQALLAGAVAEPGALGGGWAELLALCVAAGAVIAVALRVAPAALAFVLALRPGAPRPRAATSVARRPSTARPRRTRAPLALAAAGRAPPLTHG